jgi:hypothetical protein
MKRRLSREDFLELFDLVWEAGPSVRYQNPDNWYI